MKSLSILLLLWTSLIPSHAGAQDQATRPTPPAGGTGVSAIQSGVIGEVTAVDPVAKQITLKTDAGATLSVVFDNKTLFRRIPPGESSTSKAVRIGVTDVEVGDRVYAEGKAEADNKTLPARQLLVMSKEDIKRKQERERLEWRSRSIVGSVSALNPVTKEITLKVAAAGGPRTITIAAASEGVKYRRYAPDSIKFADARPSSFEELKDGDVVRALGEKSADGTRFTPEQILSGSFRTVGGKVTAINPELGEIKINDIQTQQPLIIAVNTDSQLRRMEPAQAAIFAGARSPAGAAESQGASADFQTILEKQPALKITELRPGDLILISSTRGTDPTRLTAITVIAGMDALLKQFQPNTRRPSTSVTMGLPVDIPLP